MKKILIIINPYSGEKIGEKISIDILEIFKNKNINYKLIKTTHQNHPYEITNSIDLDLFDGICVVGGDGTMNEVINGMLFRKDHKKIPIGLIPGGTGNSFMHDLDCLDPMDAAKKISDFNHRQIDIMEVITNRQTIFAYNVVGWGMIPDINILAEKMRWLGLQRYNVAVLLEIMRLKERKSNLIINNKKYSDNYSFILCCNTIHTGKGMKIAPNAKFDDGLMDIVFVKKTNRLKLFTLFPKVFSGNHIHDPIANYCQANTISIKPKIDTSLIIDGEIIGDTPCRINILPKKIDILN